MKYMNDFDIEEARFRNSGNPILSKATRFLIEFKHEVDSHSDGWAYWRVPVRAAAKLMTLVESYDRNATEAQLRAALTPIKSFYTRRGKAAGMRFPEVN